MANPQKENGYTSIANELYEALARGKFSGIQRGIIDTVIRHTYGFNRKEATLSDTYIATAIDSSRKSINREMQILIENKIISVIKEPTYTTPRVIKLNKNYDEWVLNCRQATKMMTVPKIEDTTSPEMVATGSPQNEDKGSPEMVAQERKIYKDNIKDNKDKDNKDSIINNTTEKPNKKQIEKLVYYPLDEKLNDALSEFILFRKKIKAPMTDHAIDLMIKKLDGMTDSNDDKIEILEQSILNGWKGVFELKNNSSSKSKSNNGAEDYNATVNRMYREECEKDGNSQYQGFFGISESTQYSL